MSPPRLVRPPHPEAARPLPRYVRPAYVLPAIAIIAMLVFVSRVLEQPEFVDHITFENPTVYDLSIDVSDAAAKGWLPVGTAGRHRMMVAEEIYDIGDVWVFRFGGQGQQSGELRFTRSQLAADDWHVRIPERVGQELRDKGGPPPP